MEHHKTVTSDLTTTDSNNNNKSHHHHHHHNRRQKRTAKQQQLMSLSLSKKAQVKSISYTDPNSNQKNISVSKPPPQQQTSMKTALSWKKRWTQWFSSCGSERISHIKSHSITVSIKKRTRTKSENDLSKRGSIDQDEKKKLSTTNSTLLISPNSNENHERNLSKTFSHQHQSIDKVNNSNSVLSRDTSRRYSNPFFSSIRYEGGEGGVGQHQSRTSIAALPSQRSYQKHQTQQLSRSADRLHTKSNRRELRYEEHNDYIPPPPPPLNSIQCHPTNDHYARTLNQSSYFASTHRRSQIEVYQLSTPNTRLILPRPYSSNFLLTPHTTLINIPITYSSTVDQIHRMSQTPLDNNETYGRLSECHSPLTPVENSSVKAPRRIESNYSQFPITQQEPVYANTQSLYDNILYPESSTTTTAKTFNRNEQEKKSCASQTQLTWTMATFSSFVDLENQSIIISQPDPTTFYSVARHQPTQLPPSASPATIEHIKRTSPNLQYIDDNTSPTRLQRPRTPTPTKTLMIEKRDGSFQTLLTIAPAHDLDSNKQITPHESTPSPLSTGSSSTTDHHHHHPHRHRRHKSRSNTSRNNISTRDVGLQVNIQTVKKITFSSEKSEDSSITTSTASPPTVKTSREVKNIQTNTDSSANKHDRSTSYEANIHMATSSSQTLDSPTSSDRQTKAAQTPTKSLRDQSIETNNQGLFVCDLSSFLKNGVEELSTTITKQKS